VERIDGNGLVYELNNVDDMVRTLLKLRDPTVRKRLGSAGALRMKNHFGWEAIAKRRLKDYESAIPR
jgi:glycosyltransferase involved in cell wall biosynthesis